MTAFEESKGPKTLECARCWKELGKLKIINKEYSSAYENFHQCLKISEVIYRYKPQSRELTSIQKLI